MSLSPMLGSLTESVKKIQIKLTLDLFKSLIFDQGLIAKKRLYVSIYQQNENRTKNQLFKKWQKYARW